MYDLVAVVIHIGSSLNRGHYISIVKSDGFWLLFDDDIVDVSIMTIRNYKVHSTTEKFLWELLAGMDPIFSIIILWLFYKVADTRHKSK